MLERIIRFAIEHRMLLVLLTMAAAGLGGYALQRLPIDAVPDITNKQVQINTAAAALSPVEIEKQVTFPIETALAGMPGLESTRPFAQWFFSGDGGLPRQCGYLLCSPAGERTPHRSARKSSPWGRADYGPHLHRAGRGLHVDGRVYPPQTVTMTDGMPGWQSDGTYLTPKSSGSLPLSRALPTCGRCRIGLSVRSSRILRA